MEDKSLVVKVNSFPENSETFIVSNIAVAIENGYKVIVVTNNKNNITSSSQSELLKKHKILENTKSFKKPIKKYKRYIFAFFCLLHPMVLFYFVKYIIQFREIQLNVLYKLYFYKTYRKAGIWHIHFATAADEVPILKKIGFIKSKLIVTFHGYDAFFKDVARQEELINLYSLLFEIVDKVTINTSFLKDKVLAIGCPESKLKVIPVGIDISHFKPSTYPKKIDLHSGIRLITVGRCIELKGHEFGILAVRKLVDCGFSISYTIIGEGILSDKLKLLVSELGLQNHVTLIGKCTQDDIKKMLDSSHMFLMTSVKDFNGREEAQGIVTAEAQAMGLPIIGFDSGGVSYTVSENTGILVKQKDVNALAEAIIILIENPDKYHEMSLTSRKWVTQNFNITTMVDAYYDEGVLIKSNN